MERHAHTAVSNRPTHPLTIAWFLMVLCAAVVLFSSTDAQATIVDNDWYTTDTSSNLDWADLTLTNNVTWNQMQAGAAHGTRAASGWLNEGWRHATHDEVLAFWGEITGIAIIANYTQHANDLQGLVGAFVGNTRYGYGGSGIYRSTYGYIAENFNDYYTHWMGLHHYRQWNQTFGVSPMSNITMNHTYPAGWGHWLVRSSATDVPEPGILALLPLGLLGIGAARRSRA